MFTPEHYQQRIDEARQCRHAAHHFRQLAMQAAQETTRRRYLDAAHRLDRLAPAIARQAEEIAMQLGLPAGN